MAIRWITNNRSHILYVSVQDCKTEPALFTLLGESARIIASEPEKVKLSAIFKECQSSQEI